MMHARPQIDARFGHKPAVTEHLQAWARDIAPRVGLKAGHLLTRSIGAPEHDWHARSIVRQIR